MSSIIMSIIIRHALLFRVVDGTSIVTAEQVPEEGLPAELDLGFSGFSGPSAAEFEEPEYAQGEGKPRMHNPTLLFINLLYHLL